MEKNDKIIPKDDIKLICLGLYDPSGIRDDNAGKSGIILFKPWSCSGWII